MSLQYFHCCSMNWTTVGIDVLLVAMGISKSDDSATGHRQIEWDDELQHDLRTLLRLAIREDFDCTYDITSLPLIPRDVNGSARVVCRESGVLAGLATGDILIEEMSVTCDWKIRVNDGTPVQRGTTVAEISGTARDILAVERILLNTIGHLSGVATLTSQYVARVTGTRTVICDTRKTLPGWRRLEKYAVRCGGGTNHRTGLFDAVLIKDNHLALGQRIAHQRFDLVTAVERAKAFCKTSVNPVVIEIEVDTLSQLEQVLPASPDIVLLDNMTVEQLHEATRCRNRLNPAVLLEASGGVTLETVHAIAETGVERISVRALTHSARQLDVGLDWNA